MDSQDFRRIFFPYCLQRLDDGRYIVLNRLYKPLGISSSEWVIYEAHPSAVMMKGLGTKVIQALSAKSSDRAEIIYLYNDGCVPTAGSSHWSAYSDRLKVLAKLTVS